MAFSNMFGLSEVVDYRTSFKTWLKYQCNLNNLTKTTQLTSNYYYCNRDILNNNRSHLARSFNSKL